MTSDQRTLSDSYHLNMYMLEVYNIIVSVYIYLPSVLGGRTGSPLTIAPARLWRAVAHA